MVLAVGVFGWSLLRGNNLPLPTNVTNEVPMLGAAVTIIDGTGRISADGQNWEPLTTAAELNEGDYISTEPASRVIIALDDGSAVRLDESTVLKIDSLDAHDLRFSNQSGNVYSRVVASERKFTVSVEGTGYTALGTAFSTVNEPTDKGVQVLQSSVAVDGDNTKVDEGKQFFKQHANGELKDKITDMSVDELKSSGFMIWNLEQDEKTEAYKDKLGFLQKIRENTAPAPVPETSSSAIKLTASKSDKGIVLKWTLNGVSAPEGFKVVRSKKNALPTYGKDESSYVGSDARSFTWKTSEGGLYSYRVCVYQPDSEIGCTNYSNTVKIESPEILPEAPVPGTVTLSLNGMVASWTDTGTAPHGWKVVVSTSPVPVYGAENTQSFFSGSSPRTIEELDPGTYYVRVCKYTATSKLDNGCTNYSNELSFSI